MPHSVLAHSFDKFYRLGKSFIGHLPGLCVDADARKGVCGRIG